MDARLTERQRRLAGELLTETDPVTVSELASRLKVSPRTIRYDLDALLPWFGEQGLQLSKKPRRGVQVIGSGERIQSALRQLASLGGNPYRHPLRPAERVRFILSHLLKHPDKTRIQDLADRLGVSRGTLLSDLKAVEAKLADHQIRLRRIPGHGLKLDADEFRWRQAAASFVLSGMDPEQLDHLLRTVGDRARAAPDPSFASLLPEGLTAAIESVLTDFDWGPTLSLSDRAYRGLTVHIALAVLRLKEGQGVSLPPDRLAELKQKREFRVAKRLFCALEERLGVSVPESEIGYLALHLLGAKRGPAPMQDSFREEADPPLQEIAGRMIRIVSETLRIPLYLDKELAEGLIAHLKPVLARLKYGLPLDNPILDDIRTRYPQIYAASQKAAFWLGKVVGCPIPPGEAGYLAMHFGAAVTRVKGQTFSSRRILLVCASGLGTAKLLESTLRSELPGVEWIGTTSVKRVAEKIKDGGVDLVISTVNLDPPPEDIPVVRISPLPGRREIMQLKERLYLAAPLVSDAHLVGELMEIIQRYADIRNAGRLAFAVRRWLEDRVLFQKQRTGRAVNAPMLDQLLKPENIRLQVECRNWREAVEAGAEPLLRQGAVEARYVDQIRENLIEHGPYMVIAPGIALLHARPEDGVREVCMSLITLSPSVSFGHPQNDPVDIAITFGTTDNESHVYALSQLMELLSHPPSLQRLRKAVRPEDVIEIIRPFVQKGGEKE
jgi:transcriptional antiterminator/mannitol/fructose-specific phosphotransferase system IIA component (Ntr-type)